MRENNKFVGKEYRKKNFILLTVDSLIVVFDEN